MFSREREIEGLNDIKSIYILERKHCHDKHTKLFFQHMKANQICRKMLKSLNINKHKHVKFYLYNSINL